MGVQWVIMRVDRLLTIGACMTTAAFLLWVSFFKVADSDFWWHVKAGEIMWETLKIIDVDPFDYTREELPYLARHEWLAQLILFGTYTLGGSAGIVLLRILCTFLIFGILLLIDRKRLWPNAFLAIAGAIAIRQGLIERPQLFSNVIFAAMMALGLTHTQDKTSTSYHLSPITYGLVIGLQILWVNLHGATALMSLVIFGSFLLQALYLGVWKERFFLLILNGIVAALLFASPNHVHNVTYALSLFTEHSSVIIREWNPTPWPQYLLQLGPFWIAAIISLLLTRKNWIAIGLILFVTGYLSRTASRHEAFFIIAALGCTFYQLKNNKKWTSFRMTHFLPFIVTIVIFLLLFYLNLPYHAFLLRENLYGFGSYEPVKGAVEFLNKNSIQGKMFNSYGAGGYLLFSDRKVFVDGRNVEYGFDFLTQALLARNDANVFRELEKKYGFTYAVIEYESLKEQQDGDFDFSFLDSDPLWALVYLDDRTAVYLKQIPEYLPIIHTYAYTAVNPQSFLRGTLLDEASPSQNLRGELARIVDNDTQGMQGLILLARLERNLGNLENAGVFASLAKNRFPGRYEPYEVEASILASQGKWHEVAQTLEKVLKMTKYQSVKPNYAALAELWERAGNEKNAEKYRKKINAVP